MLKEGDFSLGFSHTFVKSRGMRNAILAFKDDERWNEGVSKIRQEVVKSFLDCFKDLNADRPCFDDVFSFSLGTRYF